MSERERLGNRSEEPTPALVSDFIGSENARRWRELLDFIDASYPGVFKGEWLYGGRKHGWSLRFKKSRSFCTLIPERTRLQVLIVFGQAERDKAEVVLPGLATHARNDFLQATTYHDGKWVLINVDSEEVLSDVKCLLEVKRRPSARQLR